MALDWVRIGSVSRRIEQQVCVRARALTTCSRPLEADRLFRGPGRSQVGLKITTNSRRVGRKSWRRPGGHLAPISPVGISHHDADDEQQVSHGPTSPPLSRPINLFAWPLNFSDSISCGNYPATLSIQQVPAVGSDRIHPFVCACFLRRATATCWS